MDYTEQLVHLLAVRFPMCSARNLFSAVGTDTLWLTFNLATLHEKLGERQTLPSTHSSTGFEQFEFFPFQDIYY